MMKTEKETHTNIFTRNMNRYIHKLNFFITSDTLFPYVHRCHWIMDDILTIFSFGPLSFFPSSVQLSSLMKRSTPFLPSSFVFQILLVSSYSVLSCFFL